MTNGIVLTWPAPASKKVCIDGTKLSYSPCGTGAANQRRLRNTAPAFFGWAGCPRPLQCPPVRTRHAEGEVSICSP